MKKAIANKVIHSFKFLTDKLLTKHNQDYLYVDVCKQFSVTEEVATKYGKILFYCPDEIPIWRAETFSTKEPETLEWIDDIISDNGKEGKEKTIFWDIGANVGCYSLYAALGGLETYAFEPSSANYYILNKNICDNKLDGQIAAYCIAFCKSSETAYLNMMGLNLGGALNSFSENYMDEMKAEGYSEFVKVGFRQGMIGFSIDEFINYYRVKVPNHIKIDVDGLEKDILIGAKETLRNPRLQSVLVEIDEDDEKTSNIIISIMQDAGFSVKNRAHSEIVEKSERYNKVFNYIFSK